jgi:hypothetical protein
MFAENIDDAGLGQFGQLAHNLAGHQMKATGLGTETDFYLLNHSFFDKC